MSTNSTTTATKSFDLPLLRSSYDDANNTTTENNNNIIQTPSNRQTVPMILPVIVLFFFLVGFFAVYLLNNILHYISSAWLVRRFEEQTTVTITRHHQQPEPPHGLHPTILASFPVFPYSSVHKLRKKMRRRKCCLVCAICLSEFGDDDNVRLLTICNHVFHPECIDTWLQSQVTCPVCRCNLEDNRPEDSITIAVMQVEGEEEEEEKDDSDHDDDVGVVEESMCTTGGRNNPTIHSRGNSSSVRVDDGDTVDQEEEQADEDKYTLRLPEDAEERIVYLRSANISSTATA